MGVGLMTCNPEQESSSHTTLDPGYYVIARPQRRDAKVISGPCARRAAEHRQSIFTHQGWVMSTPGLVYAIEADGYEVAWGPEADKPDALREDDTDGGE